jgi:uncharacterized membrane protein
VAAWGLLHVAVVPPAVVGVAYAYVYCLIHECVHACSLMHACRLVCAPARACVMCPNQ